MATRRQIHIAVAHQHDNEGCKICQDKFGESGTGGDGARKGASRSGTSTPARSNSRRRSNPNPLASASFETSTLPTPPRFPRTLSDPNAIGTLGSFGDVFHVAFGPRDAVPRHTFVFSADVHPATSPRTHHHHSASLTPAQLAAHAFGPPAKGYNFGDEGGIRPWPECEQESSSSAAGYAQSEDRKKRRRSKLRYDLAQSADADEFRAPSLHSPIVSVASLEQSKPNSSPSSSSSGELVDFSSGSISSPDGPLVDKMPPSLAPTTRCQSAVLESKFLPGHTTIHSSSSAPSILQDTSPTRKRKRRSYQFRSSYHPLLRSESLSLSPSCSITSTPSLTPSSPSLSATHTFSTPSIPQVLLSPTPGSLSGYPIEPPLTISELDIFGAGATRELVDWGQPPPSSIPELQRTWRRSERAPLPPRVRRLQKMLQLEQRSTAVGLDSTNQPAFQATLTSPAKTTDDVEMAIAQ